MRPPAVVRVGACAPPREIGPLTQTDLVRFAGAGGDFNPLHHDPEFARAAGFPGPIAMGQMHAGMLAAWLSDWLGVEHLREYEIRFMAPVHLGDVLLLSGEVVAVEPLDGRSLAEIRMSIGRGDATVATAKAKAVVTVG